MNLITSIALTITLLSQVPILPPPQSPTDPKKETKAEKRSEPIPYHKKAIPKDNENLNKAIATTPVTERDNEIDASKKIVDYFIARPYLAARMMEELFDGPLNFMKDEETGDWEGTMKTGGFYTLKKLWSKKGKHIVSFEYFYRAAQGIGLKFSAMGLFVIHTRKGDDDETSIIDYDIYITAGNLPLDKAAEAFSMHREWIRGDMMSITESLTLLCEAVAEDAAEIAEEMADEDEVFTKSEIDNFKKTFKAK